MTPLQLERIGIFTEKTKLHPNRYWCDTTQSYLTIHKNDTIHDVLKMIFDSGMDLGIEEGKNQRSKEISDLLFLD